MLRLVLDTNVVLDLFHFADPAARPILAHLDARLACCLVDDSTLDELCRVLDYPEFGLAAPAATALIERYRQLATLAIPAESPWPKLPKCRDPDDQKFLELAAHGQADLLVSKDKALLKLKGRTGLAFRIVTPAEAAALIAARHGSPP